MTEQELIVNWKDHCGALATECKSLLEKNFLVDCVLSAEGKKVKAHRLVLSASSPYFQMLFSEESEKYPIVFLKDTSFGSLKALVDFMYRGEAHIPEGDLQAFLALAKSLQIKGLNNDPVTNKKGNSSHNADGNDSQLPSEDYRETQEVQDSHSNQERSLQNSSQKPQSYQSSCDTDIAQLPFAPDEVCMDSSDTVQRVSPLQEEQIFVVPRSLHSEVTVKDEPLSFEFVGLKEDPTNMSENSMNEMHEETPDAHEEEDMNQYSSIPSPGSGSAHELPEDVTMREIAEPVHVQGSSEEAEEIRFAAAEEEAAAIEAAAEEDAAANEADIVACYRPDRHDAAVAGPSQPAAYTHHHHHDHPGEPHPSDAPRSEPTEVPDNRRGGAAATKTPTGAAPAAEAPVQLVPVHLYECRDCDMAFRHRCQLERHARKHRIRCNECNRAFPTHRKLFIHQHMEHVRLFRCFRCGDTFTERRDLLRHLHSHNILGRFVCAVCQLGFLTPKGLSNHLRTHGRNGPNANAPPLTVHMLNDYKPHRSK